MTQLSLHSPLGALTISENNGKIVAVDWGWGRDQTETLLLKEVRDRLERYFDGEEISFSDLPFELHGTVYRQKIWQALLMIPYGETRSYAEIAATTGGSPRSVGGAVGANPVPILIPCHRVVGKAGKLGGYSGGCGVEDKKILLALEFDGRNNL